MSLDLWTLSIGDTEYSGGWEDIPLCEGSVGMRSAIQALRMLAIIASCHLERFAPMETLSRGVKGS